MKQDAWLDKQNRLKTLIVRRQFKLAITTKCNIVQEKKIGLVDSLKLANEELQCQEKKFN